MSERLASRNGVEAIRETRTGAGGRRFHQLGPGYKPVRARPRLVPRHKALPWTHVPATSSVTSSHGHRVRRTIKAIEAPTWVDFPAAAQVLQVRRTRTIKGRKHIEVVYIICSLPMTDAPPATIAAWIQGHWCIENKPHWVHDVIFDEDRHQLRSGHGPHAMTTLKNMAISLIRLAGHSHITASLRHHTRDSHRPINHLATT